MAVLANKSITTELGELLSSREGCNIYVSRVLGKIWVGILRPDVTAKRRSAAWTPLEQKKNANRKFAFFFFLTAADQREKAVPPPLSRLIIRFATGAKPHD
jgi:hypothetical protein